MTHAAILCRVSTEAQRDNTSLADQRRILTDLCERQGWTWEVFEEVESGGAGIANRPVLAQVLGRIAAGEFARLVVLVPDRLSRAGVGELEQISEVLARVGARLVTQSGEFDPANLDHGLALDLQAVLAKNERLRIRERTIRGRESKIKAGGFSGHAVPYGWRRVWNPDGTSRFEIVPEEAAVVREVFDLYARGIEGVHLVAARVGLPASKVAYMLRNPRYAGIEAYRAGPRPRRRSERAPIVVPSTVFPAIVTQAQWEAVQAVRARKVGKGSGKAGPAKHPLAGIIVCRRCGRGMTLLQKAGRSYYHCGYRDCPRQDNVRAEDCHRLVLMALPDIVATWADMLDRVRTESDVDDQVARLRAEIQRAEQSEFDLWAERQAGRLTPEQWGRMNDRLVEARQTIEARLAGLLQQQARQAPPPISVADAAAVVSRADHLLEDWPTLRRLFADLLVEVRVAKVAYVTHEIGRGRRPVIALRSVTLPDGTKWAGYAGPDCDM